METYNTTTRVLRGSNFDGTGLGNPASYRSYSFPDGKLESMGFRITLYLNS